VDPTYARGGGASDFFDEISFIPLETTNESSFGILQDMQVSKNYFAFADIITKAIFVFKSDGSFHYKITELPFLGKSAPGFFRALSGFVLQESTEMIYIVYQGSDKNQTRYMAVFSPDGKLIQSKQLNPLFASLTGKFSFLDNGKAVFATSTKDVVTGHYFSIIENFDTTLKYLYQRKLNDPYTRNWSNEYSLESYSARGSIWARLFDNVFYHFDSHGNMSSYTILLQADLVLNPEFYNDSVIIKREQNTYNYLAAHRDKISEIGDFHKVNDILAFRFTRYNSSSPKDAFWYSLATNNLYAAGRISADSLCYGLPVFALPSILGSHEDYIYLSAPAFVMFNAIEDLTNKKWESNPALKSYFSTQNSKSNPILVRLKFKKKL